MLLSTLFRLDRPSSSFSNSYRLDLFLSNLSNLFKLDLPLDYKKMDKKPMDEFLCYDVCSHMGIKDFSFKQTSFYENTEEIVVCIVMTSKEYLG